MKQAVNDSINFETWYDDRCVTTQVKRIKFGKFYRRYYGSKQQKRHRFAQRKYKRVWGQASW
jgi:hypothetical protein